MKLHNTNSEIIDEYLENCFQGTQRILFNLQKNKSVSLYDRLRARSYRCMVYKSVRLVSQKDISEDSYLDKMQEIYRDHFLYLQSGLNLFRLSIERNEYLDLPVDDVMIEFKVYGFDGYVGINDFIKLFLGCIIGREKRGMQLLRQIDYEKMRAEHFRVDSYSKYYIEFLKSINNSEAVNQIDLIRLEVEKSEISRADFISDIFLPELDCWESIIYGDEKVLNENLEKAIVLHNKYWSQSLGFDSSDSPRANYPEGLISWPLLAIASLAVDRGMKVTIESDYLPRFLYINYFPINAKVRLPE